MHDLLGQVLINIIFLKINLMSVYNSAKFQLCSVIFSKSQYIQKSVLFFHYRAFFVWTL
jgi:hypothetical protein